MEKHKEFVGLVDPLVKFVLQLPEDGARDQAMIRLQEFVFWSTKIMEENFGAKKD